MTKQKIFSLAVLFIALIGSDFSVAAQTPEQVVVKSLQITFHRNQTDTYFTMKTANAEQNEVSYTGAGSYSLGLFTCTPCNFVNTFSTDIFARDHAVGFRWGADKYVDFYLTEAKSAVAVLRPTISRRRKTFVITGLTNIAGRVEIKNERGIIIAEDKNVRLAGGYAIDFFQNNIYDGRKVDFSEINYSLNKTND